MNCPSYIRLSNSCPIPTISITSAFHTCIYGKVIKAAGCLNIQKPIVHCTQSRKGKNMYGEFAAKKMYIELGTSHGKST